MGALSYSSNALLVFFFLMLRYNKFFGGLSIVKPRQFRILR